MYKKHKFTFSERRAIYEAHKHICIYCRDVVAWKDFEVDHIINKSLLKKSDRLASLIEDYDLDSEFSINSFQNWACAHNHCNRTKSDTTFDKSRALHYLMIAGRKAKSAEIIYRATESANKRGHPLKGESREKTPLHEKNTLFFLGSKLLTSTALFNPPIRARYFSLFGSRSGLLSVSS